MTSSLTPFKTNPQGSATELLNAGARHSRIAVLAAAVSLQPVEVFVHASSLTTTEWPERYPRYRCNSRFSGSPGSSSN
jgi:hypothetical protein